LNEHAGAFRRIMEDLDVEAARRAWREVMPHLPPLGKDAAVLTMLHRARTQSDAMPLEKRAYSHRWLLDRGFPSGLPDALKPQAERLYPRVVEAVGISVNSRHPDVAAEVRGAMEKAVLEAHADGRISDTTFVTARMQEARKRTIKQLFG
jgi:hypothetical protein